MAKQLTVRTKTAKKNGSEKSPEVKVNDRNKLRIELEENRRKIQEKLSNVKYSKEHQESDIPRKRWNDCPELRTKSCCSLLLDALENGKIDESKLHKPKVPIKQKLSCLAAGMSRRDSIAPQLFHLLNRFLDRQQPGNEFEHRIFSELTNFSSEEMDSLKGGLAAFHKISESHRENLFMPAFLDWSIDQAVDPEILSWEMHDEGFSLSGIDGIMNILRPGRVRPWGQTFVNIDGPDDTIIAPWPWINEVNGFRTATHRQPLPFYKPVEMQNSCAWQIDPATGEPKPDCKQAQAPYCEIALHKDSSGNCLRVPEARVGASVTLTGFNYFSNNSQVILTRLENGSLTTTYEIEGFIAGDLKTPLTDAGGQIIADHRVTDQLFFDIPEMTPDGLIEFPPGLYQIIIRVPNDISYTFPDGVQPADFTSNIAYLKILPKDNLGYRIWSDQIHCYKSTDGEVGSDEFFINAFPAVFDPNVQSVQILPTSSVSWDGVDNGDTAKIIWDILGEPGSPQRINGLFAIGFLGWEVDSVDALNEEIRAYGAAFSKFWNIIGAGLNGPGGAMAGVIISAIIAATSWWIGLIVVAVVLIVLLIVGLIWAAWAPPDRIILDAVAKSELEMYYLTYPVSALPAPTSFSIVPDIQVNVLPDSKYAYFYSEERQYICNSENSRYAIRLLYQRDI